MIALKTAVSTSNDRSLVFVACSIKYGLNYKQSPAWLSLKTLRSRIFTTYLNMVLDERLFHALIRVTINISCRYWIQSLYWTTSVESNVTVLECRQKVTQRTLVNKRKTDWRL